MLSAFNIMNFAMCHGHYRPADWPVVPLGRVIIPGKVGCN